MNSHRSNLSVGHLKNAYDTQKTDARTMFKDFFTLHYIYMKLRGYSESRVQNTQRNIDQYFSIPIAVAIIANIFLCIFSYTYFFLVISFVIRKKDIRFNFSLESLVVTLLKMQSTLQLHTFYNRGPVLSEL